MPLKNTDTHYGLVAILLHWVMAVGIVGMYFLGEYMVDLDYYHPWYHSAPDLHRSIGVVLGVLLVVRFVWRLSNPRPAMEGRRWECLAARCVHWIFYGLILGVIVSGYLISTADGQPVSVFGLFDLPATLHGLAHQEDVAGDAHEVLALLLVGLAGLHATAALKHHLVDRDRTLLKMLGR